MNVFNLHPIARSTVPQALARLLSAARQLLFILVTFSLILMTVVGIVGLYNNLKSTFFNKKTFMNLHPKAWSIVTQALAPGGNLPSVPTLSNLELNCDVETWRNERDGLPSVGTSCN
jgi:hypothetical protein